jgi:hypothetical protein
MGAPVGNQNSCSDNRLWANTIRRAIAQSDPERLRRIAEALLNKAEEGDLQAMKELGDRVDGKPAQSIAVGNEPGQEFVTKIVREIVHAHDPDSKGL